MLTGQVVNFHILALGGCGLGIAIVSLLDDLFHLSAITRVLVHFGCALIALKLLVFEGDTLIPYGEGFYSIFKWLLLAIGVVWLVNLYNFMDGIDGLAGIEAVSVSLSGAFFLLYSDEMGSCFFLLLLLAASVCGFLMLNWPPARIFMGDVGSGFLGFFFAIILLISVQSTSMTIWIWMILLGVFVVDSAVTLIVRVRQREKFHQAHRSHAYQILSRRLQSHKKVTLAVLAVNVLWLFPCAFFSISWPGYGLLFALVAYLPLVLGCVRVGAGRMNE